MTTTVDLALDRLHGIPRKAVLEKLIAEADESIQRSLDDGAFESYLGVSA